MMAPAAGFYSTPGMGRNQVRLAYVLNKKDIMRALFVLEKALEKYKQCKIMEMIINQNLLDSCMEPPHVQNPHLL